MHTADERPYMPTPDEYAQAHQFYQQAPPAAQREIRARAGVRSVPTVDGKPIEQTTPRRKIHVIALFAVAIALPAWLEGARTTRDGWIFALNWILNRAHIPIAIAQATTWYWGVALGVLVLLGWGYSRVEINHAPIRPPSNWRKDFFNGSAWRIERTWQRWIVWFVLIATDVGTMYLGARQPQAGDPAIFHQIAASVQAAAVYAILITFIPDQLLRYGWRALRGG